MAKNLTAEQIVKIWAERGANSADAVRAGVNAVTENPAAKAAAAVDLWAANVAKAKDKFRQSLEKVTLQDWKQAMLGKGLQNMQNGYNDKQNQNKFAAFMREFLPHVRAGAAQVKLMRKGTLQDGIDRAVFQIKHNAAFKQRFGGGGDF